MSCNRCGYGTFSPRFHQQPHQPRLGGFNCEIFVLSWCALGELRYEPMATLDKELEHPNVDETSWKSPPPAAAALPCQAKRPHGTEAGELTAKTKRRRKVQSINCTAIAQAPQASLEFDSRNTFHQYFASYQQLTKQAFKAHHIKRQRSNFATSRSDATLKTRITRNLKRVMSITTRASNAESQDALRPLRRGYSKCRMVLGCRLQVS